MSRYRAVFSAAWAARHELAGPTRLLDEAAFLPAALSLQETPVHPAPRRFGYAIMMLFAVALMWALFGQVDIVAVATGRVVVSERTKLVQPLERSVVQRVLVQDGDRVKAGQPLVELDRTIASADKKAIGQQVRATRADVIRARAIMEALSTGQARPRPVFVADWPQADILATQAQLDADWSDISAKLAKSAVEISHREAEIATGQEIIAKLEATLPLARQRETDLAGLAKEGYAPNHTAQDKSRERIEMERDLATQRARQVEVQAAMRASQSARMAFIAETRRTLSDKVAEAELKNQQATQDQAKAIQREKLTVLVAPVDGIVQQLAAHTAGGVVTEAQTLMVIVPEEAQVTAEVTFENKDVGFVNVGQQAEIKLETFPYTRYGTVPATVARVSADAVNDEKKGALFPATLALQAKDIEVDGKRVRLSPGMNVTAEIKTGRRKVIEYLLSPIQRAASEAWRER
ncbi:HlyD family type I secretion periplasmic adaptor subunit [Caenimonas sp. SL110]|uniref:HlyD family type I secretion periplasmic adaptor subunit n=1 Tax=Caenimonas sp. SL110 TaxID=1450524 RepID=UPI00069FE114|nr:HlyD family type I secretion periplasmic adaptor subunit [Caenimonas sp. SL110]